MIKLIRAIENLGFSKKEAEVYITVLGYGEITTSEVAEKTNLPRSTAKTVLESLHVNGFLNYYKVDTKTCWFAISPEKVIESHRNKEVDFKLIMNDLVSLKDFGTASVGKRYLSHEPFDPLKIVLDNLNKPGLLTDGNTRVLYINKQWEYDLGYKNENIVGNMGIILFKPERVDTKHAEVLFDLLRTGKTVSSDNLELQHVDGTVVTTNSVIIPVDYQNKTYFLMIVESINR